MLLPLEDRLARIMSSVGFGVFIGFKTKMHHADWLECIGGPVLVHFLQNPVINFTLFVDPWCPR
jgi:hypothetical protein